MNRRQFAIGLGSLAGFTITHRSMAASIQSTQNQSVDSMLIWNSDVTVGWDPSLFQDPISAGTENYPSVILRAPGPRNLLNTWVSVHFAWTESPDEIRDYVENDPDLMYGLDGTDNQRFIVAEDNDAFGVLYRPVYLGKADTWSYEEISPGDDSRPTVHLWLSGIRSAFDRDIVGDALSSLTIDDDASVKAVDLDELLDTIEKMDVIIP